MMNLKIVALVFMVGYVAGQYSNPKPNGPTSPQFKKFDDVITNYMKQKKVPGASLALSYKGKLLYTQGYGSGGFAGPVQPDNVFRIASISKPFTAMGIMKLAESGKLNLDQPVFGPRGIMSKYRPVRDMRVGLVTVRHMLSHTGGWRRETLDPMFKGKEIARYLRTKSPANKDAILRFMMYQPLQTMPGQFFSYCNFCYMTLGMIIEKITGQSYESYIQSLLKPIGITDMRLAQPFQSQAAPKEVQYFSYPYNQKVPSIFDGSMVYPPYGKLDITIADSTGRWIATAKDLVTFFDALSCTNGCKLVRQLSFNMMRAAPPVAPHLSEYMGYGIFIKDKGATFSHNGNMDGTRSTLKHHKVGYTWALILNLDTQDPNLDALVESAINTLVG